MVIYIIIAQFSYKVKLGLVTRDVRNSLCSNEVTKKRSLKHTQGNMRLIRDLIHLRVPILDSLCYNWFVMSKRKDPTPEELAASRDTRIAAMRLDRHERYLALLKHAQRIRVNNNAPDTLATIIASGESELQGLHSRATGRIPLRRRPKKTSDPANKCIIFIDECGASSLAAPDAFDAFVIAAIIVPEGDYPKLNKQWKRWKHDNLGSPKRFIHEPDIRRGMNPFYFKGDATKRFEVIQSLNELIAKMDFAATACVVNRPEYKAQIGMTSMDESLPEHPYLMVLDFLMERIVMILEAQFNGARSHIIAEARGSREDALLQYEYVRLQLDGTSYISPSWFRQQLAPAIEFRTKKDNCLGLQLADLLARPCGEKILDPSATPDRWSEFREKLCPGQETAHSILGLKVVPWSDRYIDIWKS